MLYTSLLPTQNSLSYALLDSHALKGENHWFKESRKVLLNFLFLFFLYKTYIAEEYLFLHITHSTNMD